MPNNDTPTPAPSPSRQRAAWTRPAVTRLSARDAENGDLPLNRDAGFFTAS